MATQPEDIEGDVLELTEEVVDAPGDEAPPTDDEGEDDPHFADEADDKPAPEPDLVKHLRQQIRDRDKRLADFTKAQQPEEEIVVGARPRAVDFDYDDDAHQQALDEWEARKDRAAEQTRKREEAGRTAQQAWQRVTERFEERKAQLRYADRDTAIQTAMDTLSPVAQSLIAMHADDPALFLYTAGKSSAKLAELARIDAEGDPFAVMKAVTKMEATLQVKRPSARPPAPDTPVRGRPISANGHEKELARLEAEVKTNGGDRTKLIAFKQKMKEMGR